MYKKFLITFLIFFLPFAIVDHQKIVKSSRKEPKRLNMFNKNNLHLIDKLFDTKKENLIEIKNCSHEGDLASQKQFY